MTALIGLLGIPFRVLGWLVKHPKIALVGVVMVVLVFGAKACVDAFGGNNQTSAAIEKPAYAASAPDVNKAPYVFTTSTRIYYVERFTSTKTTVVLNSYWTYDKKEWVKQSQELPFDKAYYAGAKMVNRLTNAVLVAL